jgi:hypothetical protein
MDDVDHLTRHQRTSRRAFAEVVISFHIIIESEVIPVSAALLQSSRAWFGPIDLWAVEDDVLELKASSEEALAAATVVIHCVRALEVVPRSEELDCADISWGAKREGDEGFWVHWGDIGEIVVFGKLNDWSRVQYTHTNAEKRPNGHWLSRLNLRPEQNAKATATTWSIPSSNNEEEQQQPRCKHDM